jgi:hypothetical protein
MTTYAYEILKNETNWLTEVLKEKEKENAPANEIEELTNKIISLRVALNKLAID